MPEVASIVLYSSQPERTIAFYRSVGVDFEDEDHGDGMVHAATEVGGVHVAVFAASDTGTAPSRQADGCTFVGFYVDSLDEVLTAVSALGATVLVDHELQDWGCRVVLEDPDGRPVEINQRDHCQSEDKPEG